MSDPALAFLNSPPRRGGWITAGALLVYVVVIPVLLWLNRRERRRWRREDALRRQLWELEDQIWLESLPDWQREAMERGHQ